MKLTDFTSFEDSANIKRVAENVDTDGVKFTLFNMHEMRYTKDQFGYKFKHLSSDPDYRTVSYGPKCTRYRRPKGSIFCELQPVYPKEGILIATKKYEDIHDKLMQYNPLVHCTTKSTTSNMRQNGLMSISLELAQPENWRPLPDIVKELKLKQLMKVLERLLRLNDDLL